MSTIPKRWKYSIEDLKKSVSKSYSYHETLRNLGISTQGGGAYSTLKKRILELNLDVSHFTGRGWNKGNKSGYLKLNQTIPLEEILIENSTYANRTRLKKNLIKNGILENKCNICGLLPKWNDRPLMLRLDHKNGINNDNRRKNLQLICPNCDSQLATFCGRNKKQIEKRKCTQCDKILGPYNVTGYCASCWPKNRKLYKS